MKSEIIIAVITGLPATIAALAAFIMTIKGNKKVDVVHEIVNSRSDALRKEIFDLKRELLDTSSLVDKLKKESGIF